MDGWDQTRPCLLPAEGQPGGGDKDESGPSRPCRLSRHLTKLKALWSPLPGGGPQSPPPTSQERPHLWGPLSAQGQDDGVGKQTEREPRLPVRLQVLPGRAPRRQDPEREVSPGPERGPHPAPCTGHRLGVLLHRLRSEGDVTAPDPTASAGRMQSSAPRVQQARTSVDARTIIDSWFGFCFLPFQTQGHGRVEDQVGP